jgi:uncharacterized protein (DUF1499 family)
MSRFAAWSNRLAWFALLLAALSVIVMRSDLLEIVPAMATFGASLVLAGLAILCSFGAAVVIWRQGYAGIGRAVSGFFLSILLLAYPGYLAYRAYTLPPLRDITTDFNNPPRFDVISRLRPRGTSDYPGAAAATLQRRAYPDLAPLQLSNPPKAAYDTALAIVTKRKWRVVDARPPGPGRREATIEAIARTPIMGFRDDVVIRITPLGGGSQVDVRSASRFGNHDFGTNASRVRSLLEDIDDLAGVEPRPDRPPPPTRQPARR